MPQAHDLDQHVIAIFESDVSTDRVTSALAGAGHRMRILDSERDHELFHAEQEGFMGKVKEALTALGDEKRVVGRFDEAIRGGKTVVAVPADDEEAPEVATILAEHGGTHIYHFGEWTFTSVGD